MFQFATLTLEKDLVYGQSEVRCCEVMCLIDQARGQLSIKGGRWCVVHLFIFSLYMTKLKIKSQLEYNGQLILLSGRRVGKFLHMLDRKINFSTSSILMLLYSRNM